MLGWPGDSYSPLTDKHVLEVSEATVFEGILNPANLESHHDKPNLLANVPTPRTSSHPKLHGVGAISPNYMVREPMQTTHGRAYNLIPCAGNWNSAQIALASDNPRGLNCSLHCRSSSRLEN